MTWTLPGSLKWCQSETLWHVPVQSRHWDYFWWLRWYFREAVNNQLCRLNIAFSLWTIWLISSPIYQCGGKMETINKSVCGNVRLRRSIYSPIEASHLPSLGTWCYIVWMEWLLIRRKELFENRCGMSATVWISTLLSVKLTSFSSSVLRFSTIFPVMATSFETCCSSLQVLEKPGTVSEAPVEDWHFIDPPGGPRRSLKMDGQPTLPKHNRISPSSAIQQTHNFQCIFYKSGF